LASYPFSGKYNEINEREGIMSEEFSEFDSVDPAEVIRTMLEAAIAVGAPVYNAGDPRGCYDIYAATARMLVRVVNDSGDENDVMKQALQEAALEPDADEQSWIMRRAFDAILGEETDEGTEDDDDDDDPESKDGQFHNLN
jgi:hypothetical protein